MDFFTGLILISFVHLLAAASPGPDFVLVSQQALQKGKKAGLYCSLGITLGLSVHIFYSIAGLATIIAHSVALLWAVKIFGGCYLIYLGISGLRSKAKNDTLVATDSPVLATSAKKQVMAGILCNLLNPKAPIYFVSVFTVVLSPELPFYQLLAYGIWMMVMQMLWFSFITFVLSNPKVRAGFQRAGHWVDRVLGAAMMLLGIKVLLSR